MRIYLILALLCMASCAEIQGEWVYSSLSDKRSVSLRQAQVMCDGRASNAALNAPQRSANKTLIKCTTTSYMLGTYNTSCNQTASAIDILSARIENQRVQDKAKKNSYSSCMAHNGWNATWLAKSDDSIPTGKDGDNYNYCLNSTENKLIKCQYEDGLIESKPECNCALLGGKIIKKLGGNTNVHR